MFSPWSTEVFNLNFPSLEVVSRYRDTQLKWLKIYVICEIEVPRYICVPRLKAYFTFNNWLSVVIKVLIKHRMSTVVDISVLRVNPLTAKLFNLNLHSLEAVSRWRDSQLQVSENYSDLRKCRSTIFKSCWLMSRFIIYMFKMWYLLC